MPNLLSIQMLVRNDAETIEQTFESVLPLIEKGAELLVGDLGCTDETIRICRAYNAQIVGVSLNNDLSQARNFLMMKATGKWNFLIHPCETIVQGIEWIESAISQSPAAYNANIFQGDVLSSEIRLWHKNMSLRFKNPVFETLPGDGKPSEIYLSTSPGQFELKMELAKEWMARFPLALEPIYYMACVHLSDKNWDTFLNYAKMYLHQDKSSKMSVIMTNYYCSMVQCYIKKDYKEATKYIIPCLAVRPAMAEFWCLLGDIYYSDSQIQKAKCFYQNALILGTRRLKADGWPMEISKYKTYPQKMIEACDKIQESLKTYQSKK